MAASPELGLLQVEYLATAGHRRMGYALPDDPRLSVFVAPRLAGVCPRASGSAWPRLVSRRFRSIPPAPPMPSPASCPLTI
jgi:hypothetical protein